MIVNKYLARDIDEVQDLINKELGPNAVILTSKHIRYRGIKSLFFSDRVEVVAAIEEEDYYQYHRDLIERGNRSTQLKEEHWRVALDELMGLHKAIKESTAHRLGAPEKQMRVETTELENVKQRLVSLGVSWSFATEITRDLRGRPAETAMSFLLAEHCKEAGPIALSANPPTIVAFIGPKGCGKTTMLMKIGYQYQNLLNKKVGIISFENHPEELWEITESSANSLGMPIFRADADMEAIRQAGFDLLLVDACSGGPDVLEKLLAVFSHIQTQLVLDISDQDPGLWLASLAAFNVEALAITKVDISTQPGNLFNLTQTTGLPVSYMSLGPELTENLEIVNGYVFARTFLRAVEIA